MTVDEAPRAVLEEARQRLVEEIQQRARASSRREFLLSFFALEPDWSKLPLETDVAALPAVRWKQRNLEILRERARKKFDQQVADLEQVLPSG